LCTSLTVSHLIQVWPRLLSWSIFYTDPLRHVFFCFPRQLKCMYCKLTFFLTYTAQPLTIYSTTTHNYYNIQHNHSQLPRYTAQHMQLLQYTAQPHTTTTIYSTTTHNYQDMQHDHSQQLQSTAQPLTITVQPLTTTKIYSTTTHNYYNT